MSSALNPGTRSVSIAAQNCCLSSAGAISSAQVFGIARFEFFDTYNNTLELAAPISEHRSRLGTVALGMG